MIKPNQKIKIRLVRPDLVIYYNQKDHFRKGISDEYKQEILNFFNEGISYKEIIVE